jgi:hypothetical protein
MCGMSEKELLSLPKGQEDSWAITRNSLLTPTRDSAKLMAYRRLTSILHTPIQEATHGCV